MKTQHIWSKFMRVFFYLSIKVRIFIFILLSFNAVAQKADFIVYRREENGVIVGDMTYGNRKDEAIDCDEWIGKYNKRNKTNFIVYVRPEQSNPRVKNIIGILPAEKKSELEESLYKLLTNKDGKSFSHSLNHYLNAHQDGTHYSEIKSLEPELRILERVQWTAWDNTDAKKEAIARCDTFLIRFPNGYFADQVRKIRLYHYSVMIRASLKYYRGPGPSDDFNANYLAFKDIFEGAINKAKIEEKPILVFLLTTYSEDKNSLIKYFKETYTYPNLNSNYICILTTNEDPETREFLKKNLHINSLKEDKILAFDSNGKLIRNLDFSYSFLALVGDNPFSYLDNDFIDFCLSNPVKINTLVNIFELQDFSSLRKYCFNHGFVFYYDNNLQSDSDKDTEYSDLFQRCFVKENIQIFKFKGGAKYLSYSTEQEKLFHIFLKSCVSNLGNFNKVIENIKNTYQVKDIEVYINGVKFLVNISIATSEKDKNKLKYQAILHK